MRTTTSVSAATLLAASIALGACSSSDDASPTSAAPTSTGDGAPAVVAGEPFPDERCAANEDAGTVTFLTGFDFAAASSIVEVLTADAAGYYDELCLDVEIRPGFSSANYPLVASGNAQFASGGSFGEVVAFDRANDADFLVASVDGRTTIDTLIVRAGEVAELGDLRGSVIGVKGRLPASIDVMLRSAGLVEGTDFDTVLLDGFDPVAHLEQPIDALPGWKSNEVGALERAGVAIQTFDPLDAGVPGSFGVIFTSAAFVDEHPTAAVDFMRATARGLADAVADPAAAASVAVDAIDAGGNPNFLSPEGETFRWRTEADLITSGTPEDVGFGVPDGLSLEAEVTDYAQTGLFGDGDVSIDVTSYIEPTLLAEVYDDAGVVVWPA